MDKRELGITMTRHLILCNMTHGTAKQPLIDALTDRRDFHTRKGTRSGKTMARGYTGMCPHCYNITLYRVFSYSTLIFEDCSHCHYQDFSSRWYSKTTLTLQNSINAAFNLNKDYLLSRI
jgi:hypothetical protein